MMLGKLDIHMQKNEIGLWWLILYINFIGWRNTQIVSKTHFWVYLWGCFQNIVAFESTDHKWALSNLLKVQTEKQDKGRAKPHTSRSIHLVLLSDVGAPEPWACRTGPSWPPCHLTYFSGMDSDCIISLSLSPHIHMYTQTQLRKKQRANASSLNLVMISWI
jgi:hypothetical protein